MYAKILMACVCLTGALLAPASGMAQGGSYYDYYLNGIYINTQNWAYPEVGQYGCSSDVASWSSLAGNPYQSDASYPSFTSGVSTAPATVPLTGNACYGHTEVSIIEVHGTRRRGIVYSQRVVALRALRS